MSFTINNRLYLSLMEYPLLPSKNSNFISAIHFADQWHRFCRDRPPRAYHRYFFKNKSRHSDDKFQRWMENLRNAVLSLCACSGGERHRAFPLPSAEVHSSMGQLSRQTGLVVQWRLAEAQCAAIHQNAFTSFSSPPQGEGKMCFTSRTNAMWTVLLHFHTETSKH